MAHLNPWVLFFDHITKRRPAGVCIDFTEGVFKPVSGLAPAGLGFVTIFFGIGQALGPAIGGYLADSTGSFTIPFLVAGGISLTGAVFSLFLKRQEV